MALSLSIYCKFGFCGLNMLHTSGSYATKHDTYLPNEFIFKAGSISINLNNKYLAIIAIWLVYVYILNVILSGNH